MQPTREPWVRAYRTALIDEEDIVLRFDGIRLTTPARTVIDLTRYLGDSALASAIEYVLGNGMCTVEMMCRVAERLNTPGRPWVRRFLRVLGQRVPGRPRESDWERRVCDGLARRGVNDIESQVGERLEGYGAVRFDLAIASIRIGGEPIGEPTNPYGRLVSTAEPAEQAKRKRDAATGQTDPLGPFVIEVDVHLEHRTLEGQSSDYRRDRKSRKEGWAVERVGEAELAVEFDGTISHLVEAVALRRVEVAALIAADLWPPTAGR